MREICFSSLYYTHVSILVKGIYIAVPSKQIATMTDDDYYFQLYTIYK
jgi:hypothetical protein